MQQVQQEQMEKSATAGTPSTDAVRVSDANLEGLYDWLRGIFSSEQEQSAHAAAGQIEALTGTATVLRDDEQSLLRLGDEIFADDTIATAADSKLTIIFSDGMEFRLGEEAKLLIDDFVFDQAASTGLQSLSAIKGAFSYQSGLLAASDPSAVTIKTPLGTLGIRGTKLMGLADTPEGQCIITLLEGRIEVTGDRGGSVLLSEKFDTAKMQIEWDHVDMSQYSLTQTESAFKEMLFGGDEEAMNSFIDEEKSSSRREDSSYTIYGEAGQEGMGASMLELLAHTEG